MKQLKINAANIDKIKSALHDVNGKATTHCYTTFSEMMLISERASRKILSILGAKKHMIGATYVCVSGDAMPNSYKYSRNATKVTMEYKSTGWFITDIQPVTIWKDAGKESLIITKEQEQIAINHLKSSFTVKS